MPVLRKPRGQPQSGRPQAGSIEADGRSVRRYSEASCSGEGAGASGGRPENEGDFPGSLGGGITTSVRSHRGSSARGRGLTPASGIRTLCDSREEARPRESGGEPADWDVSACSWPPRGGIVHLCPQSRGLARVHRFPLPVALPSVLFPDGVPREAPAAIRRCAGLADFPWESARA